MDATIAGGLADGGLADGGADERAAPGVLAQLWRRRGVVALTFCASLALVALLLLLLPVSYVATGAVIVGDREPLAGSTSAAWVQKLGDPADMESNLLLIRSPRLLRMALTEPGVSAAVEADCRAVSRQVVRRLRPLDCGRLANDPEAQLLWMQDRFGVGAVGRSRVIQIGYGSPIAEVAQTVVNALIRDFLDDEHAKMLRSRDEALDWVRSRLQQVDAELRRDEAAIEAYRNVHGLVRGINGPLSSERLTQAGQQLAEAKSAEAEAALRVQELSGGAGGSRQAQNSRAVADIKQQLAISGAQLANAAQRLGAGHPQLIALRRQQAELTARLGNETGRVGDAARRNLDAAHVRVAAAQDELARRTAAASGAAEAETQIASMVRELEIKRGSFIDLSQRVSQLETERRMVEPSTQLVNMAELPTRPAFPQRGPFVIGGLTMAAVLAAAAGLVVPRPAPGGALALGRTYTRVPILAQIPGLRLRRGPAGELLGRKREFPIAAALALLDSHPPLLELMRILHARLALAGFGTRRRSLMVASEVPREGKTFVTLALARLAAASGRRVLVIESSLRQPFLAEALNGPASPGLGGYLAGGAVNVVQLTAVPGVDFILAGDPCPFSTELLSGPRFPELLEWAKRYDFVLVDSAPVATLMDSALLAPAMEGVLFCLRSARPPAATALNSLPDLQRANGNVVGLALTFVPDEKLPFYLGFAPTMQLANAAPAGRG